jgi:hypothetical protein
MPNSIRRRNTPPPPDRNHCQTKLKPSRRRVARHRYPRSRYRPHWLCLVHPTGGSALPNRAADAPPRKDDEHRRLVVDTTRPRWLRSSIARDSADDGVSKDLADALGAAF